MTMYTAYIETAVPAAMPIMEKMSPRSAGAFRGFFPFLLRVANSIPRAPVGMDKTPVHSRRSDSIPMTREAVSKECLPLSGL